MLIYLYKQLLTRLFKDIPNIRYEERTPTFQYTEVLKNKEYLESLIKWLSQFKLSDFDFTDEIDEDCKFEIYKLLYHPYIIKLKYITFNDWWNNFIELKGLLSEELEKL